MDTPQGPGLMALTTTSPVPRRVPGAYTQQGNEWMASHLHWEASPYGPQEELVTFFSAIPQSTAHLIEASIQRIVIGYRPRAKHLAHQVT